MNATIFWLVYAIAFFICIWQIIQLERHETGGEVRTTGFAFGFLLALIPAVNVLWVFIFAYVMVDSKVDCGTIKWLSKKPE